MARLGIQDAIPNRMVWHKSVCKFIAKPFLHHCEIVHGDVVKYIYDRASIRLHGNNCSIINHGTLSFDSTLISCGGRIFIQYRVGRSIRIIGDAIKMHHGVQVTESEIMLMVKENIVETVSITDPFEFVSWYAERFLRILKEEYAQIFL